MSDTRFGLAAMLPWPHKDLSPNARLHWARSAKIKAEYRKACGWALIEHVKAFGTHPKESITVSLEFHAPDKRRRDQDNLLASMKSGLDGVADALKVDDSVWTLILPPIVQDPKKLGFVKLTIRWTNV